MENNGLSNEEIDVVNQLTNIPEEYRNSLLACKTHEEFTQKLDEITKVGENLLRASLNQFKATRNEIRRRLSLMGLTEEDLINKLAEEENYEAADKFVKANDLIKRTEELLKKEN